MKVGIYGLSIKEREIFASLTKERKEISLFNYRVEDEKEEKDFEIIGVFVHSNINKEVIDRFPKLKAIITMSTGFNHIDLEYCKQKGINVYNIPDYGTETVAEFTVLLMLAVLRKFNLLLEDMKCSLCIDVENLRGRELGGKTVGIIGTGRIGSKVIELLRGFNVKVIAYNRRVKQDLVEKFGVEFVSLEELIKRSDIISLHLPLNEETYHIINEEKLNMMKPGTVIINTARGQLIDTKALVERADLFYMGLDVVEGEKVIMNEIDVVKRDVDKKELLNAFYIDFLVKHPKAIVTPHIAYNTEEADFRRLKKTLETIEHIEKGELDLYNRVV